MIEFVLKKIISGKKNLFWEIRGEKMCGEVRNKLLNI